jgi:hypothetical protein
VARNARFRTGDQSLNASSFVFLAVQKQIEISGVIVIGANEVLGK